MGARARRDHDLGLAGELLEIDVPDPGHVSAVGLAIVEPEDEMRRARHVDGRPQRLVEAGGILGQHEHEAPAAKVHLLLPAERGRETVHSLGHVLAVDAQNCACRECGDRVVRVVEPADRQLHPRLPDVHSDAVESLQRDVGRGDSR